MPYLHTIAYIYTNKTKLWKNLIIVDDLIGSVCKIKGKGILCIYVFVI